MNDILFSDNIYFSISIGEASPEDFYCMKPKCADWEQKRNDLIEKRVQVTWQSKNIFIKDFKENKGVNEIVALSLSITDAPVEKFVSSLQNSKFHHKPTAKGVPTEFADCNPMPGISHLIFTTPSKGNAEFIHIAKINYRSEKDAQCAKEAFVRKADPAGGYSFAWELVAQQIRKLCHFCMSYGSFFAMAQTLD